MSQSKIVLCGTCLSEEVEQALKELREAKYDVEYKNTGSRIPIVDLDNKRLTGLEEIRSFLDIVV